MHSQDQIMNPRMHPRGRPRATARDLRHHVLNDQIVIQSILTHEFDGPARWPSADSDGPALIQI